MPNADETIVIEADPDPVLELARDPSPIAERVSAIASDTTPPLPASRWLSAASCSPASSSSSCRR
jgi:hypothetical protein